MINKNLSFNCYNLSEIENNYKNYFIKMVKIFLKNVIFHAKNAIKKMIVKYAILII